MNPRVGPPEGSSSIFFITVRTVFLADDQERARATCASRVIGFPVYGIVSALRGRRGLFK